MDFTFYIDNATYPLCWKLPLSILWLFSVILTLMKTICNLGFTKGDIYWFLESQPNVKIA
jgi:hypothetical protein